MKSSLLSLLAYLLFRLFTVTYRRRLLGVDQYALMGAKDQRPIYAVCHGRMFALFHFFRGRPVIGLASQSRDGEIIAKVIRWLGFGVVRGSSSRGGVAALIQLKQLLQGGKEVSITVDGPRGPRGQVKPGIVLLASKSGAPILPVSYACHRAFIFQRSWDRFMLPLPFSTYTVAYGQPIYVPKKIDKNEISSICKTIENELEAIQQRLDVG